MSQRFALLLTRFRWHLLILGLALGMLCYIPSRSLDFDRSVENMFADDDPLLPPYRKLKRTFGGNEIVLAVYKDPDLLNQDCSGIKRLYDISADLEATPGVRGILSLSELDGSLQKMAPAAKLFGLSGVTEKGIVDTGSSLSRRFLAMFEGYTHGADHQTVSVICLLEPVSSSEVSRETTIDLLREKIATMANGQITGEPVMLVDGFKYIEDDAVLLGWSCTLLLSLTILVCFRSVRWVLISVGVVQLALLLTRGILVVSGLRLSMVSSMLTAIVTVVGIATVVHVIVRFREGLHLGLSPEESFGRTVRLLAAPVFWACTTDAVGFASLLVAGVGPVRDFGLMMAIGSMMVLVSVVLLVPALTLLGGSRKTPKSFLGERLLSNRLSGVLQFVQARPITVGLLSLVFFSATAAGAYRLQIETDFTKNFRVNSPIVRAYNEVETSLGGAGVWDVLVPAPESLNFGYLVQIFKLEKRLRDEVTVEDENGQPQPALKVLSYGDAVVAGAPNLLRKQSSVKRGMILSGAMASMNAHMPAVTEFLFGQDPEAEEPASYYRIMLRAVERQPAAQKEELIRKVTEIVEEEFPDGEVTGFFVLLTNLISSIIRDQWLTFGVAMIGIGLTMTVAFLRPHYALVALIPNALPILTVTGLMGWLGLTINMGAAMIAAVSLGLSVDSSIHYISAYLRARKRGKRVPEALAEVQQSVGLAVVFSTLALIVGFSVLATSQFVPTIYFGVLVSLTMLGGLLGNLVVLPLLLRLISRDRIPESALPNAE